MASLQAGVAYVDIQPNMAQFNRALSRGMNTKLGGISRAIGKGMKFAAIGLTAAGGAAGYAFAQFEESEKIGKQTNAVIKSTGGLANVSAKQVNTLAESISRYSGVDDEAIQAGQNMLLTFRDIRNEVGKGNDIFDQATKAVTDVAVAMGSEPKDAALQLGKALNDPIMGLASLRRIGIQFTASQQEQIKALVESGDKMGAQKIILKELTTEFGGSAKAQATASGKMRVALDNLAEDAGKLLAPALTALLDKISVLAQWLGDHLPNALKAAQEWFDKVWAAIRPAVERILPLLQDALKAVWEAIKQDLWPALRDLWNAAKPVLKVLGVIIGVVLFLALKALPPLIRVVGKVIGVFLRVLGVAFRIIGGMGKVGAAIGGAVMSAWRLVSRWGGKILTWFQELPGKAAGFIASLPGKIGDVFKNMVNTIIGWWNRLDLGIPGFDLNLPGPLPDVHFGGIGDIIPDVPTLGAGGIVRRPTLAMIGESGPEAVLPLSGRTGPLEVRVVNPHDFGNDNENIRHDSRAGRMRRG